MRDLVNTSAIYQLAPMSLVILNSGSLYSTYISTVDHLPCDIVRSLWLVQSCNLAVQKEEEKLNQLFAKHGNETQRVGAGQYYQLRKRIISLSEEAAEEMNALHRQLRSHEGMLKDEILQLEKVAEAPATKDDSSAESLRKQLEEHYKNHPLPSQTEALRKEKKRLDSSGIKLILKLSKHDEPRVIRKRGRPRKDESLSLREISAITADAKVPSRPSRLNIKQPKPRLKRLIPQPNPEPEPELAIEPAAEPEEAYCFCKQPSFGDMIACDNEKCPNGEWFHYKCVGLLNRVEALKYTTQKWYCSEDCRQKVQAIPETKKKNKKRRKNW